MDAWTLIIGFWIIFAALCLAYALGRRSAMYEYGHIGRRA